MGSFGDYGNDFISRTLNIKNNFWEVELNLKSILTILKNPEGINYIFQLIFEDKFFLDLTCKGCMKQVKNSFAFKTLRTFYYFFF